MARSAFSGTAVWLQAVKRYFLCDSGSAKYLSVVLNLKHQIFKGKLPPPLATQLSALADRRVENDNPAKGGVCAGYVLGILTPLWKFHLFE